MTKLSGCSRRALVVGIDRYPHLPGRKQLAGAVRDARAMAEVLVRQFGFETGDLRLLLDEQATRERVLDTLDALAAETGPGDLLVFSWSGHGSQCPAPVGRGHVDEPDGLAETLVPHDGRTPGDPDPRDIVDDEMRRRLVALDRAGAFTTLIFDCCHAGHVHRAPGPGERWVPAAPSRPVASRRLASDPPTPDPHVSRPVSGLRRGLGGRQVVLAACRDDEVAGERVLLSDGSEPDLVHGRFTWSLLQVLTSDHPPATAGEVFRRARSRLLAECGARQTPQLLGADERLLFGGAARAARPWIRVSKAPPGARDGDEVELAGGAAQRLTVGSLWSLHAAGTPRPSLDTRLGLAEIESVGAFRSTARLLRSSGMPVVADARAYLHRAARGDARLPVALDDAGPRAAAAAAVVARSPDLCAAESAGLRPDGALVQELDMVRVRRHAECTDQEAWVLSDADDMPFAVVPVAAGLLALRRRLERRALARQVLRLENPDADRRPRGLHLRLLDPPAGAEAHALPCYTEGDRIRLEIVHGHTAPLYLYVLGVALDDRIEQIFPLPGAEEALDAGRAHRIGVADDDEIYLEWPDEIEVGRAHGSRLDWDDDGGVEFVVLLAASEPVDLRILTRDPLDGAPGAGPVRAGGTLLSWLVPGGPNVRSGRDVWDVVRVPYRLVRRAERGRQPSGSD